jgi:hypothetical protein
MGTAVAGSTACSAEGMANIMSASSRGQDQWERVDLVERTADGVGCDIDGHAVGSQLNQVPHKLGGRAPNLLPVRRQLRSASQLEGVAMGDLTVTTRWKSSR